jgi:hypothetical protein
MAVPTGRVLTSWRCSMGPTWHSPTTHEGFDLEKHGHTYVAHPSI